MIYKVISAKVYNIFTVILIECSRSLVQIGSQKSFFSGPITKALTLELFCSYKKSSFSLVVRPLPPFPQSVPFIVPRNLDKTSGTFCKKDRKNIVNFCTDNLINQMRAHFGGRNVVEYNQNWVLNSFTTSKEYFFKDKELPLFFILYI